jgi:hypothetical protein
LGHAQRLGQRGRERGAQVDRFADIPVDGGHPEVKPTGQAGVGVAVAQVGQDQQGLASSGEFAPPAADRPAVGAQPFGQEP